MSTLIANLTTYLILCSALLIKNKPWVSIKYDSLLSMRYVTRNRLVHPLCCKLSVRPLDGMTISNTFDSSLDGAQFTDTIKLLIFPLRRW